MITMSTGLFSRHPGWFNLFTAAEKRRFGFDLTIAIRRFLIHTYTRKQELILSATGTFHLYTE